VKDRCGEEERREEMRGSKHKEMEMGREKGGKKKSRTVSACCLTLS
jgi:hypothetical protein